MHEQVASTGLSPESWGAHHVRLLGQWVKIQAALHWPLALACDPGACSGIAVFVRAPHSVCSQQACEMVMDILRERDQGGFGDRNEYGSRIGGGIDVSPGLLGGWSGRGGGWLAGSRGTADSDKAQLILLCPARLQVPVPRHSVGVVIGRSGEMIKKIQNDAGVRIQFKQGQGPAGLC